MKPENLKDIPINEIKDFVTNYDRGDIREDFAVDMLGMRLSTPGKIMERDFGTIHRFQWYPIRPNAHKSITNISYEVIEITAATNATPIAITAESHNLETGDTVFIEGCVGNTAANGWWTVTKTGTNTFTLNSSIGNGAYRGGGNIYTPLKVTAASHGYTTGNTVFIGEIYAGCIEANGRWIVNVHSSSVFTLNYSRGIHPYTIGGITTANPIKIVRAESLYVKDDQKDYTIIFGLDTGNNLHIYVGNDSANTWEELTEEYICQVKTINNGAVTIELIYDYLGAAVDNSIFVDGYFNNWIAYTDGAISTASAIIDKSVKASDQNLTFTIYPGIVFSWVVGTRLRLVKCTGILPDSQLGSGRGFVRENGSTPHIRMVQSDSQQKALAMYGNSGTPVVPHQPIKICKGAYLGHNTFTIGGQDNGWINYPNAGSQGPVGSPVAYSFYDDVEGVTLDGTTIVIKQTGYLWTEGMYVYISGVQGIVEANGRWAIHIVDADHYQLVGSHGTGTYTSSTGRIETTYYCDGYRLWVCHDNQTTSEINVTGCHVLLQTSTNAGYMGYGANLYSTTNRWATGGPGTTAPIHTFGSYIIGMVQMGMTHIGILLLDGTFYDMNLVGPTYTLKGTLTQTPLLSTPRVSYLTYIDATHLFALSIVVSGGTYKSYCNVSSNGGTSWTAYEINTGAWVRNMIFISTTVGYAVSAPGKFYKTTDSGHTWSMTSLQVNSDPRDPVMYGLIADGTNVRVTGCDYESVLIFVSNDSGASWKKEVVSNFVLPHTLNLFAISYFRKNILSAYSDTNNAMIFHGEGFIRLTLDPGIKGIGYNRNWYINKYGLIPDFKSFGSPGSPMAGSVTLTEIIGEGIKIKIQTFDDVTDVPAATQYYVRGYITVLYTDYTGSGILQESDPIAQFSLLNSTVGHFPYPKITVILDPAIMNKAIYGFRFYEAIHDNVIVNYSLWAEDASEYMQVYDLLLETLGWDIDETSEYSHSRVVDEFRWSDINNIMKSGPANIFDNLNHAIDINRSYISPLFGTKGARSQGTLIAVNEGDDALRFTSIDGDNVHADENFPDMSVDNEARVLRVPLKGRGAMLGMFDMSGRIAVFRSTELEIYNVQSGAYNIYPIDCSSRNSITPIGKEALSGIAWAGRSGFFVIPSDGSQIRTLNTSTLNRYDGNLFLTDGVTPYTTDAARNSVIGGYDLYYNEVLMQVLENTNSGSTQYVVYRYNLKTGKTSPRKFNIPDGSFVNFIRNKNDEFLSLVSQYGILKYPNRIENSSYLGLESHSYEDDVRALGYTNRRGVPTMIRINIGRLFLLTSSPTLYELLMYYVGVVEDNIYPFTVKFYKNEESSPFDTQTFLAGDEPTARKITEHGVIERLEIEILIEDANLQKIRRFYMSKAIITTTIQQRIGDN
jgi:hypothetical protein